MTYPFKFNDWDGICIADPGDTLRFSRGVVCDADHPVRRLFIDRVNPEEMDGIRVGIRKSDTATNNSAYGGLNWDRYAEEGVMYDGPGCADWGGRCTDNAHMDFVNFRDANDGYGWAVPIPANREYYVDYEYSIDYQTMRLEFTDPFYINFYAAPHEGVLLKMPYIDYRWRFGVTHEATAAALPWYDRMFENCGGQDSLNCTGHHPVGYPGSREPLTHFDEFGTGYMIRSDESMRTTGTTGEFWLAMNPMAGPSTAASISANADRHTVSITPFQCAPLMSCWNGPVLTNDDGGTFYWSDIELWQSLFKADSFLDAEVVSTRALPIAGASVDIPPNYHVIMDVSPPKLAKLVVRGNLTFDDSADRTLIAERISVTGMLQVGTPEEPFEHSAKILLEGDRLSDTLVVGEGVFLGNKVLAVFGELSLHGVHRATSWSRLALTAAAGDSSITVATDVDWQTGDEIVFTRAKKHRGVLDHGNRWR